GQLHALCVWSVETHRESYRGEILCSVVSEAQQSICVHLSGEPVWRMRSDLCVSLLFADAGHADRNDTVFAGYYHSHHYGLEYPVYYTTDRRLGFDLFDDGGNTGGHLDRRDPGHCFDRRGHSVCNILIGQHTGGMEYLYNRGSGSRKIFVG